MDTVLEHLYISRELLSSLLHPIRMKYQLTPAEMLVLLFLANQHEGDTAKDIVEAMRITKSHVSVSVRHLQERGYLQGDYKGCDHRSIHLQLCDAAADVIADAQKAQKQLLSILEQGFSQEELDTFSAYLRRATGNIHTYLKESAAANAGVAPQ